MPANLENSVVATGLEKVSFHSNPKEYSNYCTILLTSCASKVMLKILQARLQQYKNWELPDVKLDLEKVEESEIKLPTSTRSSKKQENSRKASTSVSLAKLKPLIVWNPTNWKILEVMAIPDHFTCLLGNLYAGQEAMVRTRHGT